LENSRGRRFPEPFARLPQRLPKGPRSRHPLSRLPPPRTKTQVFTRRYSDHFRNRLTHTIEVAQISRTIAGALGSMSIWWRALALVHDIGHPPFGHSVKRPSTPPCAEHGLSFDHNLHALRIVEDFEQRYAAFRGLNLTFEVREGIIKHSHDYSARQHPELAEYLLTGALRWRRSSLT